MSHWDVTYYRRDEIVEHLKDHVKFPATKRQLIEACNRMEHVRAEDREWFESAIPDGTYKSPEEVFRALGMGH